MWTLKNVRPLYRGFLLKLLPKLKFQISGGLVLLFLFILNVFRISLTSEAVASEEVGSILNQPITIQTTSSFTYEFLTKREPIPSPIQEIKDENLELGEYIIVNEGREGEKISTIKITFFQGKKFAQERLSQKIANPTPKVIKKGTKVIWKELQTSQEVVNYWKKLTVWTTSYDKNCLGCNETTATGLKAGYGVVAVDPKVIPLGSKIYIPGYGFAVAGDTGGAIKGTVVDLGFDDVKLGWWKARYVDIYLLSL